LGEKQYTGRLAGIKRWLDSVTEKDLMKGAGIVILTGLFTGGAAYAAASKIELPVAGIGGTVQSIAAIGAIVMTLLGWVLSSLIYHVVATLLGGKGNRNRMFALSGYAMLPLLVQQFIRFVSYWFLGQTTLTASAGVIGVLLDHFNVFAVIGLVFVGLSIMINYGISGRKAAFVALIPTIFLLALGLWSLRLTNSAAASTQGGGLFAGFRRPG
jgi:hypothetical protein